LSCSFFFFPENGFFRVMANWLKNSFCLFGAQKGGQQHQDAAGFLFPPSVSF
jgi:hypothetical protein